MKTCKLCDRCAKLAEDVYLVCRVGGGVFRKVKCEICGETDYGGVFEIEPRRRKNRKEGRA